MECLAFAIRIRCFVTYGQKKKTNEPYLLMVEGKFLDHPKLEEGNRSRMKILKVNPNEDLPIETIESILQKALDLYRTGVIKLK